VSLEEGGKARAGEEGNPDDAAGAEKKGSEDAPP